MIVTLTANPSIDRTLEVPSLARGEVVRATEARVHPGGKGVNVARALAANGLRARAVITEGGHEGKTLLALLAGLGVEVVPVPICEPVRENVTVVEPDGTVTKLNVPGPRLSDEEAAALVEATVRASEGAEWVALCGTLPPGAPTDLYERLVIRLHGAGARVAVDTSGTALTSAIRGCPDLIKPNAEELAEAVGRPVETLGDAVEAARGLRRRGVGRVLVSLGSAGAVSVSDSVALWAWTDPLVPRSTVGAGDAALAGFLAAGGDSPGALRTAVAWGAAAVQRPGTEMPGPLDIDINDVRMERIDGRTAKSQRRIT